MINIIIMKYEKFKRGYQLKFLSIALVGLFILGFLLYSFIKNPNMPVNIWAIISGALLFIFGTLGFIRKWKEVDVIKTDGISFKLYNKRNKFTFIVYSAIDGAFMFMMMTGVLYWGKFVDFANMDTITRIILALAFFLFLISSSVDNYRRYKTFEEYSKQR